MSDTNGVFQSQQEGNKFTAAVKTKENEILAMTCKVAGITPTMLDNYSMIWALQANSKNNTYLDIANQGDTAIIRNPNANIHINTEEPLLHGFTVSFIPCFDNRNKVIIRGMDLSGNSNDSSTYPIVGLDNLDLIPDNDIIQGRRADLFFDKISSKFILINSLRDEDDTPIGAIYPTFKDNTHLTNQPLPYGYTDLTDITLGDLRLTYKNGNQSNRMRRMNPGTFLKSATAYNGQNRSGVKPLISKAHLPNYDFDTSKLRTYPHSHDKGTMNITGDLENYSAFNVVTGAFFSPAVTKKVAFGGAIDVGNVFNEISFNANRTWTGRTSAEAPFIQGFVSSGGGAQEMPVPVPNGYETTFIIREKPRYLGGINFQSIFQSKLESIAKATILLQSNIDFGSIGGSVDLETEFPAYLDTIPAISDIASNDFLNLRDISDTANLVKQLSISRMQSIAIQKTPRGYLKGEVDASITNQINLEFLDVDILQDFTINTFDRFNLELINDITPDPSGLINIKIGTTTLALKNQVAFGTVPIDFNNIDNEVLTLRGGYYTLYFANNALAFLVSDANNEVIRVVPKIDAVNSRVLFKNMNLVSSKDKDDSVINISYDVSSDITILQNTDPIYLDFNNGPQVPLLDKDGNALNSTYLQTKGSITLRIENDFTEAFVVYKSIGRRQVQLTNPNIIVMVETDDTEKVVISGAFTTVAANPTTIDFSPVFTPIHMNYQVYLATEDKGVGGNDTAPSIENKTLTSFDIDYESDGYIMNFIFIYYKINI